MDRFDIPTTIANLLKVAVETGLLDPMDVYALGSSHGEDWDAMVTEIVEIAFSDFHSTEGRKIHKEISKAADLYYKEKAA